MNISCFARVKNLRKKKKFYKVICTPVRFRNGPLPKSSDYCLSASCVKTAFDIL